MGVHPAAMVCRAITEVAEPGLDVDAGELEAICLAQEIHADAVLMDDRAGRSAAIHCGLAVVGAIGILEQAAARGLIELAPTLARLQHTNARLDPGLIHAALARDQVRRQQK
jgi:predicted nucleic acid-binding protein